MNSFEPIKIQKLTSKIKNKKYKVTLESGDIIIQEANSASEAYDILSKQEKVLVKIEYLDAKLDKIFPPGFFNKENS